MRRKSDQLWMELMWVSLFGILAGLGMGLCFQGYYISGVLAFIVFIYESTVHMEGVITIFEGIEKDEG